MKGINMEYNVNFLWDDETNVWIATSDEIPGLVLESDSFDILKEKVKKAIPELLVINKMPPVDYLVMHSECRQKVYC